MRERAPESGPERRRRTTRRPWPPPGTASSRIPFRRPELLEPGLEVGRAPVQRGQGQDEIGPLPRQGVTFGGEVTQPLRHHFGFAAEEGEVRARRPYRRLQLRGELALEYDPLRDDARLGLEAVRGGVGAVALGPEGGE